MHAMVLGHHRPQVGRKHNSLVLLSVKIDRQPMRDNYARISWVEAQVRSE